MGSQTTVIVDGSTIEVSSGTAEILKRLGEASEKRRREIEEIIRNAVQEFLKDVDGAFS